MTELTISYRDIMIPYKVVHKRNSLGRILFNCILIFVLSIRTLIWARDGRTLTVNFRYGLQGNHISLRLLVAVEGQEEVVWS